MTTHDEDLENNLRPAENLLERPFHTKGLADESNSITKILHVGVLLLELSQDNKRVGREQAHNENHNNTGNEAKCGED